MIRCLGPLWGAASLGHVQASSSLLCSSTASMATGAGGAPQSSAAAPSAQAPLSSPRPPLSGPAPTASTSAPTAATAGATSTRSRRGVPLSTASPSSSASSGGTPGAAAGAAGASKAAAEAAAPPPEPLDAMRVILQAVDNCKPLMKVLGNKAGAKIIFVPKVVDPREQRSLAIRWIVQAALKRQEASRSTLLSECLARELLLAYQRKGAARQKRDDLHKVALENRANVARK